MTSKRLFLAFASCLGLTAAQTLTATLPNGRRITPAGEWITTAPYPFAIAVRPDGRQLVIPSIGFPFALNIIDHPGTPSEATRRIPAASVNGDSDVKEIQVHTGVTYSPDSQWAYVATGDTGALDVYSASTWQRTTHILLDGRSGRRQYRDSFAASVIVDPGGRRLYVLDQANWRVVIVDVLSRHIMESLPTGVNPIAICLSPDGSRLYVANSGLFEYTRLPKIDRENIPGTGLHFAPFGYPSHAARSGARVEGRRVPGLGRESDGRGSSLWTYQLPGSVRTVLRLGDKITESKNGVVGGAAPSALAADADTVYVALAHQDSVAVVSPDGKALRTEILLNPFPVNECHDAAGRPLRGSMPSGLAVANNRLYVTEAGLNAVATIDVKRNAVLSQLPVGWNSSAVAVSIDRRSLYVVNTKGKGTGPNGGKAFGGDAKRSYIGELAFGSLSVVPLAAPDQTAAVITNNKAALTPGTPLPRLKHVFLIIRENRTFDEVFGDLPGTNGDSALARYGLTGWTEEKPELQGVSVTPNAHALARQFATSDNFYADSEVSADGHRWILGIAPTPWMNIAWTSSYGGRRHGDSFSAAPGRRAKTGGSDAPMPEDEPEFGSLWEHVAGARLRILNYGEGLEIEGSEEMDGTEPEGQRNLLNAPLPKPIFEATDRAFPTFNLGVPDQLRFVEFQRDFSKRLEHGKLPSLIVIRLPNDHTADVRPADGYKYRASYVADNDLALGKMVQFISQSRIWNDSAIFVTEDDAQGGRDHVDAHRTVLLVASPWARHRFISHQQASFPSIQKTIYRLLGLGPLNLEDALSSDLSDMFMSTPVGGSYASRPSDLRIFDPAQARIAKPKATAERAALLECDNPRTIAKEHKQRY